MLKLTRFFVSIATICLITLLTATVHAADISVNSSCSLADAISAANTDAASGGCAAGSGADTITLTRDVTLTASLPEIESEIMIKGNGYTISGNERHQIFWVEEDGSLAIQNATLADGRGVDDDDLFDEDVLIGGAIVSIGSLDITDSIFTGNSATWGGAILNFGETHIIDSNFTSNSAKHGGAIYSESGTNTVIVDSTFTNNTGRGGGAAYNLGDITVRGSAFVDNSTSGAGGAILTVLQSKASISDSSFMGNSASSNGGAIYSRGDLRVSLSNFISNTSGRHGGAIQNDGETSISESNFTNNTATQGGAIYDRDGASISGSVFSGNSAVEDGGAIHTSGYRGELITNGSTFTGNSAGDEGGAIRSTEYAEATVSQTMFRDNSAEDGGAIYSWGELHVRRSTFLRNSAIEEGGAIANHGQASINSSILADNPGGDCHLGRRSELLESGNNHISDGSCGATWSGAIEEGYCPAEQELDGVCHIGAPSSTNASDQP